MSHYSLRANEVQLLQIELRIVQYLGMETIGEAVKKLEKSNIHKFSALFHEVNLISLLNSFFLVKLWFIRSFVQNKYMCVLGMCFQELLQSN